MADSFLHINGRDVKDADINLRNPFLRELFGDGKKVTMRTCLNILTEVISFLPKVKNPGALARSAKALPAKYFGEGEKDVLGILRCLTLFAQTYGGKPDEEFQVGYHPLVTKGESLLASTVGDES